MKYPVGARVRINEPVAARAPGHAAVILERGATGRIIAVWPSDIAGNPSGSYTVLFDPEFPGPRARINEDGLTPLD